MRIGFISTRFAGTDGVSLETRKWAEIFRRLGHACYYLAGEKDPDLPGRVVPEMHFRHPAVARLTQMAFGRREQPPDFAWRLAELAETLARAVRRFLEDFHIDLVVVENALTIPMNLPLGMALRQVLAETGVPTIAHHHDFYWERERYAVHCVGEVLEYAFPPDLPNLVHVVINTAAQRDLRARRGLDSVVVPNIFDFARAAPGISAKNDNLRQALGLGDEHLLILQPTRVVRRKGIELALALVRALRRAPNRRRLLGKEPVLVISHHAGDEGVDYLQELKALAYKWRIPLYYAAAHFGSQPAPERGVFSLWDAYIHADFVTYPSLYEGFGNALLEAIYFRLPIMVNRYHVFVQDIAPLGFDLIQIDGQVTSETVEQVVAVLRDPVRRRRMVERNYEVARAHFSYEAVTPTLQRLVEEVGREREVVAIPHRRRRRRKISRF